MILDIFNFIFSYMLSGLILTSVFFNFLKDNQDRKFALLLGYGIAPFFVSLVLYYLYAIFPQREWVFYFSIVVGFFLLILFIFKKQANKYLEFNFKSILHQIKLSIVNSNIFSRIITFFIIFIIFFSFAQGVIHQNTWIDNSLYLQQGYVYSQDRALDRLETGIPFFEFNNNKIAPPNQPYIMNASIRPALPILYSFFFKNKSISEFEYFSTRFVYFYYFILSILTLYYFLKRYESRHALIGVLAFVSCYYVLVFGPFFNAKEIIITFLSFLSVMIINKMKESNNFSKFRYAIIIGIIMGLVIFVNTSGIIIGGILLLLLLKEVGLNKKAFILLLTTVLFIVLFSGFELKTVSTFIFNNDLLLAKDTNNTLEFLELSNYKITNAVAIDTMNNAGSSFGNPSKFKILLMGKLQGLTQFQFFGFLFIIFLITMVRVLKNNALTLVTKSILLYMGLFFFVVMDPFFLNPHKYAYVLSISPKYTVLLTIFAAFFIAYHFSTLTKIKEKASNKFIFFLLTYFLFFISIANLIPPVRKTLADILYFFISKIIPLYNNIDYYIVLLNDLIFSLAILYITLFVILYFLILFKKIAMPSMTSLLSIIIIIFLFIFPCLFILNSNYNIIGTLRNMLKHNKASEVNIHEKTI